MVFTIIYRSLFLIEGRYNLKGNLKRQRKTKAFLSYLIDKLEAKEGTTEIIKSLTYMT